MLNASLVMALLLQSAAGAETVAQSDQTPREWVVIVSAGVYLPDGGVRAETMALPVTGAGLVHLFSRQTLCAPAASAVTEPADAAFGWRIASQIVTRTDTSVVVTLDWRRLWDGGKRTNSGPGTTAQLTMHPGDRIPLDQIVNMSPSAECRAVGLGLEVKLARMPPPAPPPAPSALPLGATPGGAAPVNAELWLTHTSPSGTEQVSRQLVRVPENGGRFTFTQPGLSTTRGEISVEIAGTIDRFRSPNGEFLVLFMNRHVSGGSLPAAGVGAITGTVVPMPGTAEVLEFGLSGARPVGGGGRGGTVIARSGGGGAVGSAGPPEMRRGSGVAAAGPRGTGGGGFVAARTSNANLAQVATLLEGHQFSLRLRITPVN
jgi:hypothetical protein